LAAHLSEFLGWTPANVKLLLPPRQSRGISRYIRIRETNDLRLFGAWLSPIGSRSELVPIRAASDQFDIVSMELVFDGLPGCAPAFDS